MDRPNLNLNFLTWTFESDVVTADFDIGIELTYCIRELLCELFFACDM